MDLLTILEFPDPRLRLKAEPVSNVTSEVTALCDAMLETMYQAPGIGLAATQVNVQKRILVCDVSEDKSEPLVLINPEIETATGDVETQEGCLSVPGFYEPVNRQIPSLFQHLIVPASPSRLRLRDCSQSAFNTKLTISMVGYSLTTYPQRSDK